MWYIVRPIQKGMYVSLGLDGGDTRFRVSSNYGVPFLGVPIMRIEVFWGLYVWETTI